MFGIVHFGAHTKFQGKESPSIYYLPNTVGWDGVVRGHW